MLSLSASVQTAVSELACVTKSDITTQCYNTMALISRHKCYFYLTYIITYWSV